MDDTFTIDPARVGDDLYWCDYSNHWTEQITKTEPIYMDGEWHHNSFICEDCWNQRREN